MKSVMKLTKIIKKEKFAKRKKKKTLGKKVNVKRTSKANKQKKNQFRVVEVESSNFIT